MHKDEWRKEGRNGRRLRRLRGQLARRQAPPQACSSSASLSIKNPAGLLWQFLKSRKVSDVFCQVKKAKAFGFGQNVGHSWSIRCIFYSVAFKNLTSGLMPVPAKICDMWAKASDFASIVKEFWKPPNETMLGDFDLLSVCRMQFILGIFSKPGWRMVDFFDHLPLICIGIPFPVSIWDFVKRRYEKALFAMPLRSLAILVLFVVCVLKYNNSQENVFIYFDQLWLELQRCFRKFIHGRFVCHRLAAGGVFKLSSLPLGVRRITYWFEFLFFVSLGTFNFADSARQFVSKSYKTVQCARTAYSATKSQYCLVGVVSESIMKASILNVVRKLCC